MSASADEVRWPVLRTRVSRPTDDLEAVAAFYRDGVGLPELARFIDHDGWDGVVFGLPGHGHQLEFSSHVDGSPCPAPSAENVLVLALASRAACQDAVSRMRRLGHAPVEMENPYWAVHHGVAFADPDGWRILFLPPGGI